MAQLSSHSTVYAEDLRKPCRHTRQPRPSSRDLASPHSRELASRGTRTHSLEVSWSRAPASPHPGWAGPLLASLVRAVKERKK